MAKSLSHDPHARLAAPDTLRGAASSVGQMALPFSLPASYPRSVRHSPVARAGYETGSREGGQASVELVAALPTLVLAGLLALQLLATGYALTLADGAAEAGALALASGRPAIAAARDSLPGWAAEDVEVSVHGGRVTVRLRPPSPLPAVAERLVVSTTAAARPK